MMVEANDLVGVAEIADAAGVDRSLIAKWGLRDIGFPIPVAHLALGPIWLWPEVEAWLVATGREPVGPPRGPYDRHEEELADIEAHLANDHTLYEACAIVAARSTSGPATGTLARRLRFLYPGWKARERTRR